MTFGVSLRLTGATEFSAASPIATFLEGGGLASLGAEYHAVIKSYDYNAPTATAHTLNLTLRPPWSANADEQIILEAPTAAANSFTKICGPQGGIVVPRRFRLEATSQPTSGGTISLTGDSYELFFFTTGKDQAATLSVEWSIERVGD